MPFWSSMLCPIPYEEVMPYALNFPANKLGNHKKVCPIIEYALSWYMPYMRVDCSQDSPPCSPSGDTPQAAGQWNLSEETKLIDFPYPNTLVNAQIWGSSRRQHTQKLAFI